MASAPKRGSARSKIGDPNLLNWQITQPKRGTGSGRKPLPEPTSLGQVAVMVVMHVCRKIVLFEPEMKVAIYLGSLAIGSLVFDFLPIPRTYFSNKDNVFNKYFVKLGWGWTLSVVGSFVALTSYTYCCGNRVLIKKHLGRMAVGTAAWYLLTTMFVRIESLTGSCSKSSDKFVTRQQCIRNGLRWYGFDVSGHAFLLVYCSLLIMEEAKCIRGWERIGELIRYEEYDEDSPLKALQESERVELRESYPKFTPYIKGLFVGMTLLLVLWDVMLVSTILYFHTMVQKVLGGIVAVLAWFVTYRVWYHSDLSPGLPGNGLFRYADILPSQTRGKSITKD